MDIKVKRTGFPITIAGVEFFFDSSVEGVEKYAKDYQEAVDHLNSLEEIGDSVEDRKNILRKAYDTILGEGSFNMLYDKIPDVIAWNDTFFVLIDGIEKEVSKVVKEQTEKTENIMKLYDKKKQTTK